MSSVKSERSERETFVIIPPDGGWGWAVVAAAFFTYFITDGMLYSFGIFLQDIAQEFNCKESKVSLAGAINSCLFCISGPFSAALVNRFGYRIVTMSGSVIAASGCVITSFSPNIYTVISCYGVMGGIGFGMVYITAIIVVGFYFERWRALATGLAVCGAGIGGLALPPIFTLLLREIGWRNTFRVVACLPLMLLLVGFVFRPIKPTRILITSEAKPSVSHVPKKGSYFEKYSNTAYSTVLEGKGSTFTIRQPSQLKRSHSSEIATTNLTESAISGEKLTTEEDASLEEKKKGIYCCPCSACFKMQRESKRVARPMYRDDIFYGGSIVDLPEYKSIHIAESKAKPPNVEYTLSVTRIGDEEDEKPKSKKCGCHVAFKRTIATMLDFRLFKSKKFILLTLNGIGTSLGLYTPYLFLKDSAEQQGFDKNVAFWLISTIGVANTIGRISCGLICTIKQVEALCVGYTLLFIGGMSSILSTLSYAMWTQFLYCSIYGFCMASMSALRTIIIVSMLGLNKLSNAVGMILMFQGFGILIGVSLSGFLKDITGDYKCSFYFSGTTIVISAIFLIIIHILISNERKRNKHDSNTEE